MKKKSASKRKATVRSKRLATDPVVEEFERRDLGGDIRRGGAGIWIRRPGRPTSIVLDEDLVSRLRAKGAKRGLGYQTMLKLIVREHLEEY
jgi:uncharacterized protein (DUF4415 family)